MRKRLLTLLLFLPLLFVLANPQPVTQTAYRAVRATARVLPVSGDQGWMQIEGEQFRLHYQATDQSVAEAVLTDLESSWRRLGASWSAGVPEGVDVFLYPAQQDLQDALGGGGAPTLGAYRLGRLYLLSPLAWLPGLSPADAATAHQKTGPIAHELVHLGLDYRVAGNTPLWFSEGMAQYWEWQLKGYYWEEPGVDWVSQVVPLPDLESAFGTTSEYAAYRQALSVVHYLYNEYGNDNVEQIMIELSLGRSFDQAALNALGMDLVQLDATWSASLRLHNVSKMQDMPVSR